MDIPQKPPLIEVEDASVMVEQSPILHGITLRTDAQRVGIVGRNGSGKTTLARLLAGLIAPQDGRVRIGGIDVAKDRRAALETVGILFQNPDHQIIFPTVAEEIGFGLRQMGRGADEVATRVEAILARFDKIQWQSRAISEMSQGQRQLICLMAILVMNPKVIVLDEPFAGLDIPTALHLTRVLAGIEATLVQITHDPTCVAQYDHVIWIDAGKVVQQGPAGTVLGAFERAMTKLGACDDFADLAG